MSAKYKRIKQADLALPAPLRWLTRAFSSITLSVFLLTFVAIYGALGSVPLYFMTIGAAWVLIGAGGGGAHGAGLPTPERRGRPAAVRDGGRRRGPGRPGGLTASTPCRSSAPRTTPPPSTACGRLR